MLNELRNSVKKSSHNDAAFQNSSHLPNGAPRFEECNDSAINEAARNEAPRFEECNDSAINENAAVSNDGGERHEAALNEAYNVETD